MKNIEEFMRSFGFVEDPLTVILVCALFLLFNFAGGLFSNILLAFTNVTYKLRRFERPSFRLALISEVFLVIFIIFVHTVLETGFEMGQIIFWGFVILASPLLAAIGGQLTYVALAKRIDALKRRALRKESQQVEEGENGEEQQKEAPTSDEEAGKQKLKEEAEVAAPT